MKTISLGELLLLHEKIIMKTGGSEGIRDLGLIESALKKAFSTFNGADLYQGTVAKIAAVSYALIKNHGFIDGNKRIGIAAMLLLLRLNEIKVQYSQAELVELGLSIAAGSWDEKEICNWILKHKT